MIFMSPNTSIQLSDDKLQIRRVWESVKRRGRRFSEGAQVWHGTAFRNVAARHQETDVRFLVKSLGVPQISGVNCGSFYHLSQMLIFSRPMPFHIVWMPVSINAHVDPWNMPFTLNLFMILNLVWSSETKCSPTTFYKNCWIRRFPGIFIDIDESQRRGAQLLKFYQEETALKCSRTCCLTRNCKFVFFNLNLKRNSDSLTSWPKSYLLVIPKNLAINNTHLIT